LIKLPEWHFKETSEVQALITNGDTTEITRSIVTVRQNDNIVQGLTAKVTEQSIVRGIKMVQLRITGQKDTNGGMVYNQIKYNWRDNIFTALSKTPDTDLRIVLP
jgi:hypothetical protein